MVIDPPKIFIPQYHLIVLEQVPLLVLGYKDSGLRCQLKQKEIYSYLMVNPRQESPGFVYQDSDVLQRPTLVQLTVPLRHLLRVRARSHSLLQVSYLHREKSHETEVSGSSSKISFSFCVSFSSGEKKFPSPPTADFAEPWIRIHTLRLR